MKLGVRSSNIGDTRCLTVGRIFCNNPEMFGDGSAVFKLPNNRPTFFVKDALPGISRESLISACATAFGRWSEVCDVVFTLTTDINNARFVVIAHDFGSPGGVLADCELPTPGKDRQLIRLDVREPWIIAGNPPPNRIDLVTVLCHEMGHGIGLVHLPASPPPDLMEPTYNPSVNKPQTTEAGMMAKLYGNPLPKTPTPPGGVDFLLVTMDIVSDGALCKTTVSLPSNIPAGNYKAKGRANRL